MYRILPITFKGRPIPTKQDVNYLGLTLDTRFTWAAYIKGLQTKLRLRIKQLNYLLQSHTPHQKTVIHFHNQTTLDIWLPTPSYRGYKSYGTEY